MSAAVSLESPVSGACSCDNGHPEGGASAPCSHDNGHPEGGASAPCSRDNGHPEGGASASCSHDNGHPVGGASLPCSRDNGCPETVACDVPLRVLRKGPDYLRSRILNRDSGFERLHRRSAVELLQETKPLYVKTESVLEEVQQPRHGASLYQGGRRQSPSDSCLMELATGGGNPRVRVSLTPTGDTRWAHWRQTPTHSRPQPLPDTRRSDDAMEPHRLFESGGPLEKPGEVEEEQTEGVRMGQGEPPRLPPRTFYRSTTPGAQPPPIPPRPATVPRPSWVGGHKATPATCKEPGAPSLPPKPKPPPKPPTRRCLSYLNGWKSVRRLGGLANPTPDWTAAPPPAAPLPAPPAGPPLSCADPASLIGSDGPDGRVAGERLTAAACGSARQPPGLVLTGDSARSTPQQRHQPAADGTTRTLVSRSSSAGSSGGGGVQRHLATSPADTCSRLPDGGHGAQRLVSQLRSVPAQLQTMDYKAAAGGVASTPRDGDGPGGGGSTLSLPPGTPPIVIPTISAEEWRAAEAGTGGAGESHSAGHSPLKKDDGSGSSGVVRRRHRTAICRSRSDLTKRFSNSSDLSQLSARLSRNSADLEKFFNEMGLDRTVLDPMMTSTTGDGGAGVGIGAAHALSTTSLHVFESVSSIGSAADTRSWCSEDSQRSDAGLRSAQVEDRTPSATSVVERNARIIKWLCNMKKMPSSPSLSHSPKSAD